MLLELHNLTVSFDGFVAVDHVNLSVEDGGVSRVLCKSIQ